MICLGALRPPQGRGGRGFTLLEAVAALAILTVVLLACLRVRAQMLDISARSLRQERADRSADALFQCVANGLLGSPTVDEKTGLWTWQGKQDGVAYHVERSSAVVPNPAQGALDYQVADTVQVFRYVVTLGTTRREFLWLR